MKLSEFKSAAESCIKDAAQLKDGVSAVNALLEAHGFPIITHFPEVDEAQVLSQDGMPCGVLAVVSLLREKYGRPVAAYAA